MKIKQTIENQHKFFASNTTKDLDFRIDKLKKLRAIILRHEEDIYEALKKDLGKPKVESFHSEVGFILHEISYTLKHLRNWAKNKKAKFSITVPFAKCYIHYEPLGVILNISPWNYPFQLALAPIIGAIAAGNCCVIKPSEISIHTSNLLRDLINKNFNVDYLTVIEGDAKVATEILEQKFDHIFYTGSEFVGKKVLEKSIHNLTPVTLELGGKSPVVVDKNTNLEKTARKIVWGKFMNAGQICVSPDYILVQEDIEEELVRKIKVQIRSFYSSNPKKSKSYCRIINQNHFNRLKHYLEEHNISKRELDEVADKKELYLAPLMIRNPKLKSKLMHEEIFGPILPIIKYKKVSEAINFINNKPKPLALYIFSNSKAFQNKIITETSSGGITINDTIMHVANPELPFGGVGNSGMGKYHGKETFELFSNRKSIVKQTNLFEIKAIYPPYKRNSLNILKKILK